MNWEQANKNLDERRQKALLGGGQSKIDKQHAGGKLTARERLDLLFDQGTFVETDAFIESRIDDFDLDKRRVPGDGVVTGYGYVDGRLVFAASEDFTVIGGTLGEYHSMKICRLQDMAMEMKAPLVCVNDSGGARIEEGISSLSGYAGMFLRHTKASGVIPQIAVILGPCSGGACYAPAICDGEGYLQNVYYRPQRGENGHQRGHYGGRAGRCRGTCEKERRFPFYLRYRRGMYDGGAKAPELPAFPF